MRLAALAILAPALVFAQLTVHNAVALMFPAWVPLGSQRARGLDAMGQRLIMLGGTWLLLIVMTIPGAIAAGMFWLIAESCRDFKRNQFAVGRPCENRFDAGHAIVDRAASTTFANESVAEF